jgi:ribose/xylose/arabinose/galactoside ABC-type transport system permease subunit
LQQLGPLLALAVVLVCFGVADELQGGDQGRFFSTVNLQNILAQTAIVAVAAMGMTVVIISGGIDLSAGTALALSATVLAYFLNGDTYAYHHDFPESSAWIPRLLGPGSDLLAALDRGWCVPVGVVAAMGAGCLTGLVNGFLISVLRIAPFIVTLGTMTIYLGIAKYVAVTSVIRPELRRVPTWLATLLKDPEDWLGLPLGVWLLLLLAIVLAAVLRYTVFGRYVFALGSNESTARLCGVNVPLMKMVIYALSGLFVGIAGIYQFSRLSLGNPTSGVGLELKVIAAVVIGGGSLSGGQGSVLGTLTGAAIIFSIANGCNLLGFGNPAQDIIIGLIIILAVTLDQFRQRRAAAT